jgi:Family of unknown function (DUF5677)
MGKGRKKRKKDRKKQGDTGGFGAHKKVGSRLLPPLAQDMPIVVFDFERDLLPEHLWIGALVDRHGIEDAHKPYYRLLDAVDEVWTEDYPPLGLISDFGLVAPEKRAEFKELHRGLIADAFHEPIGRIVAFYSDCPARWLVDEDLLTAEGSLDPEVELSRASQLVVKLIAAKDEFAGHSRMLPLGRILKHGKLAFPQGFPLADALSRYPQDCTEDEKWSVQSMGRMQVNELYHRMDRYSGKAWPKYFWRHNYDLVPCDPVDIPLGGSEPVTEEQFDVFAGALGANASATRDYLDLLSRQARVDLYDPVKDEILLGLLSRSARLYVLLAEDPNLWARDMAGILLRCLAETAISFGYLAKSGKEEDFQRFREYGEGQEKLLMLHLEESHPEGKSLEGRDAKAIKRDLGVMAPALLQIELGSWSGKDTRKLASAAGLEHLYRLVFTPGSGDVHGTWASLSKSNLAYCSQALHRFHRLPSFSEPPFFLQVMIAAQDVFETCVQIGVETMGLPELDPPLARALHDFDKSGLGGTGSQEDDGAD